MKALKDVEVGDTLYVIDADRACLYFKVRRTVCQSVERFSEDGFVEFMTINYQCEDSLEGTRVAYYNFLEESLNVAYNVDSEMISTSVYNDYDVMLQAVDKLKNDIENRNSAFKPFYREVKRLSPHDPVGHKGAMGWPSDAPVHTIELIQWRNFMYQADCERLRDLQLVDEQYAPIDEFIQKLMTCQLQNPPYRHY